MNQTVLDPHGPGARAIAELSWLLFGVSGFVYVAVVIVLVWAFARRRHDSDDAPHVTARIARVVTGAVVLTALTLVGLTAASVAKGRGLNSPTGPGAITVDVIGHQWWWDFQYHDVTPSDWVSSPNELHIPVGVPVVIKAQSRDVIHSFWVPNLHGKRDLTPGIVTNTWIQADTTGVYRGQCAEFCGYQHAKMGFVVVAEPMDKFLEWIQHQRQPASPPGTEEQRQGHDVFMSAPCVTCHTVRGTAAGSRVGPDLTHVAARLTIAAGALPNTRGHLAGWISNPQSIKPGSRMPATGLSAAELQSVLSYVRGLR